MDRDEVTFIVHDNFFYCSFLAHSVQRHHSFRIAFTPHISWRSPAPFIAIISTVCCTACHLNSWHASSQPRPSSVFSSSVVFFALVLCSSLSCSLDRAILLIRSLIGAFVQSIRMCAYRSFASTAGRSYMLNICKWKSTIFHILVCLSSYLMEIYASIHGCNL